MLPEQTTAEEKQQTTSANKLKKPKCISHYVTENEKVELIYS